MARRAVEMSRARRRFRSMSTLDTPSSPGVIVYKGRSMCSAIAAAVSLVVWLQRVKRIRHLPSTVNVFPTPGGP